MTPSISFVMPTRNRAARIGATIDSIRAQTLSTWELIIVDDHGDPADGTAAIVASYSDDRIRYVRLPDFVPAGISTARNAGNQLARGPIIGVVDSDDLFVPERVQLTVDAFAQSKCDVFYGRFEMFTEETGVRRTTSKAMLAFDPEALARKEKFLPHASMAYTRQIAHTFPYNSFFVRAADYELSNRLAAAGKKFYFCDELIYTQVLHGTNISYDVPLPDFGELAKLRSELSPEAYADRVLDDVFNGSSPA